MRLQAIEGEVLGVKVYRGFAAVAQLARISKADIYDQKQNPTGTQRDLSPKHAKDAYEYVRNREFGFWPEVFLSVRDSRAVSVKKTSKKTKLATLEIDEKYIESADEICISRLDGNHRLHYADGQYSGFERIEREISFCIAVDLQIEDEIRLFRDINNNQRRMNTSHLDNIDARLSDEDKLKIFHPDLYLAQRLAQEETSPFHDMVYDGGKKLAGVPIPLRSLRSGINYMFSQATKLSALDDREAQYKVIENYFVALKKWEPDAWKQHKSYLMLRGAGLWGVCFLGAEVIDRALAKGKFSTKDLLQILNSGKDWDWTNSGDFQGLSGRGGAVKIRDMIISEIADEDGLSIKSLASQILKA